MVLRATQHSEFINDVGQADLFGKSVVVLTDENGQPVKQAKSQAHQMSTTRTERQKHTASLLKERQRLTDAKCNASLLERQQIRLNLINITTELSK